MENLTFIKFGGSLITDKDNPSTALIPQIDQLAGEIRVFQNNHPESRILIGHGSGSFGHVAAKHYGTRNGVKTPQEWQGFATVWSQARLLNQIVIERLGNQGLQVICFPLSASAVSNDHKISDWNVLPIQRTLEQGLIPIIYGDVILDRSLGGTIQSTEEQFEFLASRLHPERILLAGVEMGIWQDFPIRKNLLPTISLNQYQKVKEGILDSVSVDVTGGMDSKVEIMFQIIRSEPSTKVRIFSGKDPGALLRALNNDQIGTLLTE